MIGGYFCRNLKDDCQLLLFSATYDAQVMKFASVVVPDAIIIRLRREEESLDNIKQFYVECNSAEDKYEALANLYGALTIGQTMVFCHVSITLLRSRLLTSFGSFRTNSYFLQVFFDTISGHKK